MGVQTTSFNNIKQQDNVCKGCIKDHKGSIYQIEIEHILKRCEDLDFTYIKRFKKNNETHIVYICNKHYDKGLQTVSWTHLKDIKGCKYCYGRSKSKAEFIKSINNFNNNVEIINYDGTQNPIECRCKTCGYEWATSSGSLRCGCGCPMCALNNKKDTRKSHEDFVSDLFKANPNIEVIGQYITCKDFIKVKCKICGCIWESYASNLLNNSAGCPTCRSSSTEYKMVQFLISKGFTVVSQKRYKDCRNKQPLPFDAFLPDYNILIEYDGEYHYMPIKYGTSPLCTPEETLQKRIKNDEIKTAYCKKNNINLIRIPFWERHKMESFLCNKLIQLGVPLS